ncbi:MAG: hypothetical protein KJ914_15960 [Gammaproteobacteria bacterium]|nr:hypothetical protein [Gammaproteobacteria bacterium]MBU1725277.1 hypothetical protein [Gammaproteobacteria bacterium]MBU2006781.1 hypothetical protein [Gammaproteobacteria bacterium]
MLKMSILACLYACLLIPLSAQAMYICRPNFTRTPPKIVGLEYEDARITLLENGWEPVQKSFGRLPETERCEIESNKKSCQFIFRDPPHHYALVVKAEYNVGQTELKVVEHSFRCRI